MIVFVRFRNKTERANMTTNVGLELLGTWRRAPLSITASYTYVRCCSRPVLWTAAGPSMRGHW